jgi:nucleotide-binding universal stress UspA family protein
MEEKLITLVLLPYPKAEILRSLLEAEGIDCFLENVNLLQGAVASGVSVKIREKDLSKAFPILEEMLGKVMKDTSRKENYLLVPVDFSTYSKKAVKLAFQIAHKIKSQLVIYHSSPQPGAMTIPYSDVIVYDSALFLRYELAEEETRKKFTEFMSEIIAGIGEKEWKKVHHEYIVKVGDPEEDILSYSRKHPPRLIVMGIRGSGAQEGDLMGSITAGVISRAKVPVLAIPEICSEGWLDNLKTIGYATNFDDEDFVAIDKLVNLVKTFDAKVICVHVKQTEPDEVDLARLNSMKDVLIEKYKKSDFECQLLQGPDVLPALDKFITENKIDVLALTTHRRNLITRIFNPSIARQMVFHSKTPLLIFHA